MVADIQPIIDFLLRKEGQCIKAFDLRPGWVRYQGNAVDVLSPGLPGYRIVHELNFRDFAIGADSIVLSSAYGNDQLDFQAGGVNIATIFPCFIHKDFFRVQMTAVSPIAYLELTYVDLIPVYQ